MAYYEDTSAEWFTVSSRTSTLNKIIKYQISPAELKRRIGPPECLNASYLNGILRRAKNRNGGIELRAALSKFGIDLPQGRRKSAACTTFTSLCEGEATKLSVDFASCIGEAFPKSEIGQKINSSITCGSFISGGSTIATDDIARIMLTETFSIVQSAVMTMHELGAPQPMEGKDDSELPLIIRNEILRFSHLTHGCGVQILLDSWKLLAEVLSVVSELNNVKTEDMDENSYYNFSSVQSPNSAGVVNGSNTANNLSQQLDPSQLHLLQQQFMQQQFAQFGADFTGNSQNFYQNYYSTNNCHASDVGEVFLQGMTSSVQSNSFYALPASCTSLPLNNGVNCASNMSVNGNVPNNFMSILNSNYTDSYFPQFPSTSLESAVNDSGICANSGSDALSRSSNSANSSASGSNFEENMEANESLQTSADNSGLSAVSLPLTMNTVYVDPTTIHCTVPGRLSLNNMKYSITIAEIWRRIHPPECLNTSFLSGILRKAKNRNGGEELRRMLLDAGMTLPSGRRKSAACTTFTSLCEGEAIQLSIDYNNLLAKFPTSQISKLLISVLKGIDNIYVQLIIRVISERRLQLNELCDLVESYEANAFNLAAPRSLPRNNVMAAMNGVIRFSRLTHGFGNRALLASWRVYDTILEHLQKFLENGLWATQQQWF